MSYFETMFATLLSMADAIQTRKMSQENIQLVQQEKSEKKRILAEQQRDELKELKNKYKELSKEIDNDSQAAINHIKYEADEEIQEYNAERKENKVATYNRRGVQQNSTGGEINQSSARSNRSITVEKPAPVAAQSTTAVDENDQFYKVQDRGSRVSESSNGYTIETHVPPNEKDSFRMSVTNNRAVLSGKRKFQDSVEEGNKKLSTNNFQTFHEEFKFERPVASEGMTRERDGDTVKFFIPKLESLKFDEES